LRLAIHVNFNFIVMDVLDLPAFSFTDAANAIQTCWQDLLHAAINLDDRGMQSALNQFQHHTSELSKKLMSIKANRPLSHDYVVRCL
jgi:hypothetical protein